VHLPKLVIWGAAQTSFTVVLVDFASRVRAREAETAGFSRCPTDDECPASPLEQACIAVFVSSFVGVFVSVFVGVFVGVFCWCFLGRGAVLSGSAGCLSWLLYPVVSLCIPRPFACRAP
jgi:hypothetical protein